MNNFKEYKNFFKIYLEGKHKGITLVDKKDYKNIKKYNWVLSTNKYVKAFIKGRDVYLHRFIMKPKEYELVDHINKNTLDNRRCNLRIVDKSKNAMNSKRQSNNTSGKCGVYWAKENDRAPHWRAVITIKGRKINIGRYKKKEDAIKARILAEEKYFGEYNTRRLK